MGTRINTQTGEIITKTAKKVTGKIELKLLMRGIEYVVHCYRQEGEKRVGYFVKFHIRNDWQQKRGAVYIGGQPSPEDLGLMERPDYSIKGEKPELDKQWRQYNRLEVEIMRSFLDPFYNQAMEALEREVPKIETYKFNRKAGCKCGCSPGFVSQAGHPRTLDVYVEVVKSCVVENC